MTDRYGTLRQGLVGAWCPSISGGGYTLPDLSPTRANGTLTNMGGQTLYQANGGGIALNFDATNDQVALPTTVRVLSAGRPFSLCWWERITANTNLFPARFRLLSATNTFWVTLATAQFEAGYGPLSWGQTTGLSANNKAAVTSVANAVGKWRHIAIVGFAGPDTTTNANWACYENGISVAISNGSPVSALTQTVNLIGYDANTGVNGPDCLMDDIRIYSRAITQQEAMLLASRRGIGLRPTRHRRANVLGSQFWLRDAGTWKKGTPWVKVNGVWTKATPKLNVTGAWK